MMGPPWDAGDTPAERESRLNAYDRLASAAKRVGVPLEQLHDLLRQVANNETATRRFLSDEVYHVPDELLDDLIRVRLKDLDR